jgi:hypothetical protein
MKKTMTAAASAAAALALAGALLVPTSATASEAPADPAVHQAEGYLTGGGGLMPAGENTPQYVSYPEGATWSYARIGKTMAGNSAYWHLN